MCRAAVTSDCPAESMKSYSSLKHSSMHPMLRSCILAQFRAFMLVHLLGLSLVLGSSFDSVQALPGLQRPLRGNAARPMIQAVIEPNWPFNFVKGNVKQRHMFRLCLNFVRAASLHAFEGLSLASKVICLVHRTAAAATGPHTLNAAVT